jgi:hypothetical protein
LATSRAGFFVSVLNNADQIKRDRPILLPYFIADGGQYFRLERPRHVAFVTESW